VNNITTTYRGEKVQITSKTVSSLEIGDVVIGPCGHERIVRKVAEHRTGNLYVLFNKTSKKWLKPAGEKVLVVVRE